MCDNHIATQGRQRRERAHGIVAQADRGQAKDVARSGERHDWRDPQHAHQFPAIPNNQGIEPAQPRAAGRQTLDRRAEQGSAEKKRKDGTPHNADPCQEEARHQPLDRAGYHAQQRCRQYAAHRNESLQNREDDSSGEPETAENSQQPCRGTGYSFGRDPRCDDAKHHQPGQTTGQEPADGRTQPSASSGENALTRMVTIPDGASIDVLMCHCQYLTRSSMGSSALKREIQSIPSRPKIARRSSWRSSASTSAQWTI